MNRSDCNNFPEEIEGEDEKKRAEGGAVCD